MSTEDNFFSVNIFLDDLLLKNRIVKNTNRNKTANVSCCTLVPHLFFGCSFVDKLSLCSVLITPYYIQWWEFFFVLH